MLHIAWLYPCTSVLSALLHSVASCPAEEFQLLLCPAATEEQLLTVHTKQYIRHLAATAAADSYSKLRTAALQALGLGSHADNYVNQHTDQAAKLAAGGAIAAAVCVTNGRAPAALALVRPPGHHAEHSRASGYCFFANGALAAEAVLQTTPITQVILFDADVHDGNGTRMIYLESSNVFNISFHRYDK